MERLQLLGGAAGLLLLAGTSQLGLGSLGALAGVSWSLPLGALGVGAVQLEVPLGRRELLLERAPGLVGLGLPAALERLLEPPPFLDRLVEPGLERLQLPVAPGELGLQLQLALLRLGVLIPEVPHQLLGGVELGAEPEQLVGPSPALGVGGRARSPSSCWAACTSAAKARACSSSAVPTPASGRGHQRLEGRLRRGAAAGLGRAAPWSVLLVRGEPGEVVLGGIGRAGRGVGAARGGGDAGAARGGQGADGGARARRRTRRR